MQDTNTYPEERFAQANALPRTAAQAARPVTAYSSTEKAKALFLLAAGASFLFSVLLWFLVDREQGLFVGLWVPSILALGALLLSGKGARS